MPNKEDVKVLWRGVSFGQLLTVLFVGLKLTHVINWSWWLVTMPFWFGYALFFTLWLLISIVCISVLIAVAINDWYQNIQREKRVNKNKSYLG